MTRTKLPFTLFICLLLLSFNSIQQVNASAADINTHPIHDQTKDWEVTFNKSVSKEAHNLQEIYIQSSDSKKHDVSIQLSADLKKVTVQPKKPYLYGEVYTLVIPKEFKSATGVFLNTEVQKSFQLEGGKISSITAIANPLVTNIIVKASPDIFKITYSVNGSTAQALIRNNNQFSRGQPGLIKGDLLTIKAYNAQNELVETTYYDVK